MDKYCPVMYECFFLLVIAFYVYGLNYQLISPDGLKDLWCPESCFGDNTDLNMRKCCACESVPSYALPGNIGALMNVQVEILDVHRNYYKIMVPQSTIPAFLMYQFICTGGHLRCLPVNLCNFNLVKIDLSNNLLTEIGNVSCLVELDTLVMANNQITAVTNATFANLTKLRHVDLSFNMIAHIDYNVFQSSDIFTLVMDGNSLKELDIANIFKVNKTACLGSFTNSKTSIEVTNKANYQAGLQENAICNDINLSNTSFNTQPLFLISNDIDIREIPKYAPCGETLQYGSAFNCDCLIGEFMHLLFDDFVRVMKKEEKDNYCNKPDKLANIRMVDVYNNQTMRDLMICDIHDFCPKNGECKCTCTSKPNRNVLIVDCSNQSCTDFPEIVPETRHDIILNMSNNKIKSIHANKTYFSKVKVLDLKGNAVIEIKEDISSFLIVSDIIITDHKLLDLPKNIQLLDPNIFHFGNNGIPCTCENRWIGEWRSIKKASHEYPYALLCSNYEGKLFESELDDLLNCDPDKINLMTILGVTAFILLMLLILALSYYFRYEIIIGRKLLKSKSMKCKRWEIDVYISFDEDNEEIRSFILVNLEKKFRKNKMTTYIQCRDAWVGYPEEENVRNNMLKCKYVLIVQTFGMYSTHGRVQTRRFEYRLAWDLMVTGKLAKIFIVEFDKEKERFMASKTRSLSRYGLTLDICDRKRCLYKELAKAFNEPIIVNSKHKLQRVIQIKANLLKKDLTSDQNSYFQGLKCKD